MHTYEIDDRNGNKRTILLKTKIVATVGLKRGGRRGKEQDEIFDRDLNPSKVAVPHGELLKWLIEEGADVIRLNMSFASLEQPYGAAELEVLEWLNANKHGVASRVAVLGDLPGPKIRLKLAKRWFDLKRDKEKFWLDFAAEGRLKPNQKGASVLVNEQPFDSIARIEGYNTTGDYVRAKKDVTFVVGDGEVELKAIREDDGIVECTASREGRIAENKGLTIKYADIEVPAFQEPDRKALDFLLENGGDVVAFIGVSFVKNSDDIVNVKKYVENYFKEKLQASSEGRTDHDSGELLARARRLAPAIIAKIETPSAARAEMIDRILDFADGVMVARGDLALQLDPQMVPAKQKDIIRMCNLRGKPVITATQMLDSMEKAVEPTRAEATDVFNAILDGTDAVMLSGETSKGKYPPLAVRTMVKIAEQAEEYYFARASQRRFQDRLEASDDVFEKTTERMRSEVGEAVVADDAWKNAWYQEKLKRFNRQETTDRISQSTCILSEAEQDKYKAIIAPSTSGRTARMISRFRPKVPIVGAAHDDANARKLVLSFGVYPLSIGEGQQNVEDVFIDASEEGKRQGYVQWKPKFQLLKDGDTVISTSGTPLLEPGTTNLIQIRSVLPLTDQQRADRLHRDATLDQD